MSTVRIYKVAELLNASSQEVMDLLKREAGIEVKSASSTIEEVVARQFVERHARERNIALPTSHSQMFNDAPATRASKKGGKASVPEPPRGPALPPPRLVKASRIASPPPSDDVEYASPADFAADVAEDRSQSAEAEPAEVAAAAEAPVATEAHADVPHVDVASARDDTSAAEPSTPMAADEPSAAESEPAAVSEAPALATQNEPADDEAASSGRVVPPSLHLRVEDPNRRVSAPPLRPARIETRTSPGLSLIHI